MSEIPQLRPNRVVVEVNDENEGGSTLIPKINLGLKRGKSGKRKKLFQGRPDWLRSKKAKIALGVLVVFLVLASIVGILIFRVYKKALLVKASVQQLMQASESQDLALIKTELVNTKKSIEEFGNTYNSIAWLKIVPFIGNYVSDGEHAINAANHGIDAAEVVVQIIEPYADLIGFSGSDAEEPGSGMETAQDRIDFVINTIPEVIPRTDELIEKISLVKNEIDYIDYERYPDEFAGYEIKANIKKGKEQFCVAADLIANSKPLLEVAPYLMGVEGERTYMIIFQNDKELRPTGGFITAYSIAKVTNGRFEPVSSSDIYNLDNLYTPTEPAPEPIIKYLKGPYLISKNLRLRDMNWSPDFSESMELFSEEIDKVGINDIDGIIAVDTELLVNILDVLGPIGVPGYGNFSNEIIPECNCPQVIYELESFADIEGPIVWSENEPGKIVFAPANYDNRKKIIGPLMNSVLSNSLGQSKEKIPALFGAVFKSLTEKHVLFYMLDEEAQSGVDGFGIAGTISDYEGDYLHINDANLGGRKSNLYVTQEVAQEVDVGRDGAVTKTVTITYKNPEKYDGWLNSVLPNYVRIYVPKGSELIDMSGIEDKTDPYEEFGKTVYGGLFELRPQGVVKVVVTYKLPFKVLDEYKLFIQKQPGTDKPLHSISVGKKSDEFFLKTDKELNFSL